MQKNQVIEMPNNGIDNELLYLFFLIGIPLIFTLLVGFAFQISDFKQELKYLNCEIERTDGEEQKYWIRRRRKLWLSLIPFVKY